MVQFRLCFLYGETCQIEIEDKILELKRFRQLIKDLLPPYRDLNDYLYIVSGKPPHLLNINDEQQFNQHQTLITNGCYIWMKLK